MVIAGFKTGAIGAVIDAGGGASIIFAALRNLFLGRIDDLKKFADESQAAAEHLLSSINKPSAKSLEDERNFSTDRGKSKKIQQKFTEKNDATNAQDIHNLKNKDESEEGCYAWLIKLFCMSSYHNDNSDSFTHRLQQEPVDFEGGMGQKRRSFTSLTSLE